MSTFFTFEWPLSASNSVYVTGTFDGWSKSTRLVKSKNGGYSVTIEVPKEKVLFKYVVDGNWLTAPNFKVEKDSTGIENNVIYPEDLKASGEINDFSSFHAIYPSPQYDFIHGNSKSDTESSAFTNVSIGDFSPFGGANFDINEDTQIINTFDLDEQNSRDGETSEEGRHNGDDDEDDVVESILDSDEMVSSTQGTLLGVQTSLTTDSNNLVNIQEGNRQVRYYTSMSLLSRFTKYFN